jgi:biotin carboxylase
MTPPSPVSVPVLLLGCDHYLVAACRQHALSAIAVYGPTTRDGFGLPDAGEDLIPVFVDDQSRAESVLAGLSRAGLDRLPFAAVLTSSEESLVTAGLLGSYLGCRAIDPRVGVNFRDKSVQKRLIKSAGIPVTDFIVIEDLRSLPADLEVPEQGGVLKPIAGAGTMDTVMVRTREDIEQFANRLRSARSSLRTFQLERYVKGRELIADGVAHEGEVVFCCLGEYSEPCLTTVAEQKVLCMRRLDPAEDEALYAKCAPVIDQAIGALGPLDGVFHMELFEDADSGDILFSECAARRGGGLTQEEVQAKFGVSLAEQAVLTAVGQAGTIVVKADSNVFGTTYLGSSPGTLVSCPSPADLLRRTGVRYARVDAPFGQVMTAGLTSTFDRIGALLIAAPDVAEFHSRVADVREWFAQRTVIIPPGLNRAELRAWQRDHWPDADFSIPLYREGL